MLVSKHTQVVKTSYVSWVNIHKLLKLLMLVSKHTQVVKTSYVSE